MCVNRNYDTKSYKETLLAEKFTVLICKNQR
jgi:hypothetical protein